MPAPVRVLRGGRRPPLIAVSTSEVRDAAATVPAAQGDPRQRELALGMSYPRAIELAGGMPMVVPPTAPTAALESLLERVDGVCFSGGPDLHPSAYGCEEHAELGPTEPALDVFELALARAADERGLPVLAICRGLQLLNVARGGTLHQHLPDVVGDRIVHRQRDASDQLTHWIRVVSRSRVAALLGHARAKVNSFHHQAVRTLGHGLRPVAWASDGVVEALETDEERFVVGVQWHAECLVRRPGHRSLFSAFVGAAAGEERPVCAALRAS